MPTDLGRGFQQPGMSWKRASTISCCRAVHGDGHMRFASLATDVTFNPHVFDVTLNEFEKHADVVSEETRRARNGRRPRRPLS
eukprot:1320399-Pyramimonas_sp.AAC.1